MPSVPTPEAQYQEQKGRWAEPAHGLSTSSDHLGHWNLVGVTFLFVNENLSYYT